MSFFALYYIFITLNNPISALECTQKKFSSMTLDLMLFRAKDCFHKLAN